MIVGQREKLKCLKKNYLHPHHSYSINECRKATKWTKTSSSNISCLHIQNTGQDGKGRGPTAGACAVCCLLWEAEGGAGGCRRSCLCRTMIPVVTTILRTHWLQEKVHQEDKDLERNVVKPQYARFPLDISGKPLITYTSLRMVLARGWHLCPLQGQRSLGIKWVQQLPHGPFSKGLRGPLCNF